MKKYEITHEQMVRAFMQWNKDMLEHPEDYGMEVNESQEYAESQVDKFLEILKLQK